MGKAVAQWPDARLDDLATALEPGPTQVAILDASVKRFDRLATTLEGMPAQIAVLGAGLDRLQEGNRTVQENGAGGERQLLQIAWGLVTALLGASAALIATLIR